MTRQSIARLRHDMAEDGMILNYLGANHAYMVTFVSWDGPRIYGPASITDVATWWDDICRQEAADYEPCYE